MYKYGKWTRKFKHKMSCCFLNRVRLFIALDFVTTFKQAFNSNKIRELAVLEIMRNFKEYDAHTLQ